ncbi:MAG: Mobile element protein [Phycisphaerales bacterium]|nr:Mobile element protein [Phycisphaerales bacterium]
MDGSWHDWLEGRGPWCCLMVMIDDATGRVMARFYERETLDASFDLFGRYVKARRGLPRALYVDKAGIYRAEAGCPPTQFGRAMGELGVELILANSPQAKGRVERMNGTLQDRLVKELRLRGVTTVAGANAVLDDGPFLKQFNKPFAVKAAKRTDVHVKVRAALKLDEVLCAREARAVGHDWCVQWRGRLLQIDAMHAALNLPRPGRRVTVIAKASGDLLVRYAGAALTWAEVSTRPAPAKAKRARKPVTNNQRWLPGSDHPFNRPLATPRPRSGGSGPRRLRLRGPDPGT